MFYKRTTAEKRTDWLLYSGHSIILEKSPDEYMYICNKHTSKNTTLDLCDIIKIDNITWLIKTTSLPMPFIDLTNHSQDGLHRMDALRSAFGNDYRVPVVIVGDISLIN